MEIEYNIKFTEAHLIETMLRYRMQIWWRKPFYTLKWILAVLIGALFVLCVKAELYIPTAILGGILGALLLGWPIDKFILRHRFRKSPYHNSDVRIRLNETGVVSNEANSQSETKWDAYTKARRFNDGLLIFQGPHLFNWLPDIKAAEPASVSSACELVRRNVVDYKEIQSIRNKKNCLTKCWN